MIDRNADEQIAEIQHLAERAQKGLCEIREWDGPDVPKNLAVATVTAALQACKDALNLGADIAGAKQMQVKEMATTKTFSFD